MTRAAPMTIVFVAVALGAASLVAAKRHSAAARPQTYVLPEETATLRDGPGKETAQSNCSACHSVDYVTTQPPGKGRAFWEGAVKKMVKAYHARISDEDAKTIIDYLSATY